MSRKRAPGLLGQMFILLVVSLAGTGIARFASDAPLPINYNWSSHVIESAAKLGMPTVTVEQAKAITDSFSHLVLDARKHADYLAGRLPGAMSLPVSAFDEYFEMVAPLLSEDFPVLVYCSGLECDESIKLGEILIESGFTNVTLFAGGMIAWTNAGFSVEQ